MSSSRPLKSLRFSVAVFFLLLAACTLSAQQNNSPKPFSKDDLVKLLKGNVPPKRVGELAQERGIDFAVTVSTEADLRRAGADDALLASLHSLVPKSAGAASSQPATLLITSTPGGARVYVDDEPVGTTSSQGRLKLSTLAPGAHHLRLSLDGYLDHEQDAELIPEQTTTIELALSQQRPSVSAPSTSGAPPVAQQEIEFWKEIKDSKNAQDYQSYIKRYPNGAYTQLAEDRIANLQRDRVILENTSWDVIYWNANYEISDDVPHSNKTFSLGSGSKCTAPLHKTCTWKVEGGTFFLQTDETDLEWAVEYSGGLNGQVMEGILSWTHDQTRKRWAKFRAQISGKPQN